VHGRVYLHDSSSRIDLADVQTLFAS
jgi:hypothetical protein